ncbi:hypothetical protein VNO77_08493 [Canavalia gladiata]|uniref:Secreted protein n=1 Tax=Canavalia gladiata TaxID=3824 RepID=A0AAN9M8I9_CANGL
MVTHSLLFVYLCSLFGTFMLVQLGGSSCLQVQFLGDCCLSFVSLLCKKCSHECVVKYVPCFSVSSLLQVFLPS